jgi:hypothetical protein
MMDRELLHSTPSERHVMNYGFLRKGIPWVLVGLYAAACIWRAPQVFEGRFWAEEGAYYALFPTFSILKALFQAAPGYPMVLTNAAVLLAGVAPIEYAPLVTTFIGFGAQLLLAALILFWHERIGIDLPLAAMAAAVLAVLPHAGEITANTTNLQWIAAALSAVILIDRSDGTTRAQIFCCCVLFVGGLSGVAPALLIPAFILKWALDKSRASTFQTLSLAAAALLVMAVALLTAHQPPQRTFSIDPNLYLGIISAQNVVTEFVGFNASVFVSKLYIDAPNSMLALFLKIASFTVLAVIFVIGISIGQTRRTSLLLFVAYWCSILVGIFGSLGAHNLLAPIGRYFFAPNVMMLLLLAHLGSKLARPVVIALFVWLVVVHSLPSAIPGIFFEGPSWREQIQSRGIPGPAAIKIWPAGWAVTLR